MADQSVNIQYTGADSLTESDNSQIKHYIIHTDGGDLELSIRTDREAEFLRSFTKIFGTKYYIVTSDAPHGGRNKKLFYNKTDAEKFMHEMGESMISCIEEISIE